MIIDLEEMEANAFYFIKEFVLKYGKEVKPNLYKVEQFYFNFTKLFTKQQDMVYLHIYKLYDYNRNMSLSIALIYHGKNVQIFSPEIIHLQRLMEKIKMKEELEEQLKKSDIKERITKI